MVKHHTLRFTRRNLPHWIVADASYFVTLRLAGTLPKAVVDALRKERETSDESEEARAELARKQFVRIESLLDSGAVQRKDLADPGVARLCLSNLEWLRNRGWKIFAATFLGNHAHLLIRNVEGHSHAMLDDIDNYKGFTGREANRILGREGRFWARDQFDHWLRNGDKFDSVVRYIAENPVKAGLVKEWTDWPWTVLTSDLS